MALNDTPQTTFGEIMEVRKTIPPYQRDFVWEEGLVLSFLESIWEAYTNNNKGIYYCGSMVVYEKGKNTEVYEIVDGQQRTTVLYILACQLMKIIGEESDESDFAAINQSRYVYAKKGTARNAPKEFLFKHKKPNIMKIYEDVGMGRSDTHDAEEDDDVLLRNLKTCNSTIASFIKEKHMEGGLNIDQLWGFYSFIIERVKFTHYLAKSMGEALITYSRLNSGGKALGYLEIIKGNLFDRIPNDSSDRWDTLEKLWDDFWIHFNKEIQVGGVGNHKKLISEESFLSYYFLVKDPKFVDKNYKTSDGFIPSNKIDHFLLNREVEKKFFSNPEEMVKSLTEFVKLIINLREGEDKKESNAEFLKDIALLSQTQTQPLMFLAAAKNQNQKLFEAVLPVTRNLVFVFTTSVTGTGSTSAAWKKLAREINKNSGKSFAVQKKNILNSANEILQGFWKERFVSFVETASINKHRKKVKIVLLMNEIAAMQKEKHPERKNYNDYYGKHKLDVDHLQPENLSNEEFIQKVGNAALLGPTDNRAVKDKPFADNDKQDALSKSAILTTRAVVSEKASERGKTKNIVEKFSKITEINAQSVDKREEEIIKCIGDYFGIK